MDKTALYNISYGLFVLGARDRGKYGGRYAGCVVNTVLQATANPVTITVCVNKDNYTNGCIKSTGEFTVSILSERVRQEVFGVFGFHSSRDTDKFSEVEHAFTSSGLPYLTEGVTGYLQCKVASFVENHTHTIFIADVTDAANLSKDPPMTYAYYHNVVRGKTAKNAPTYVADDEGGAAGATVAVGAVGGAAGATRAAGAANAAGATGVVGGTTGTTGTAVAAGAAGASGTLGAAGEVVFKCGFCGYEYRDIDLPFSELPDTFYCPICRAAKENFALTAINKSART